MELLKPPLPKTSKKNRKRPQAATKHPDNSTESSMAAPQKNCRQVSCPINKSQFNSKMFSRDLVIQTINEFINELNSECEELVQNLNYNPLVRYDAQILSPEVVDRILEWWESHINANEKCHIAIKACHCKDSSYVHLDFESKYEDPWYPDLEELDEDGEILNGFLGVESSCCKSDAESDAESSE